MSRSCPPCRSWVYFPVDLKRVFDVLRAFEKENVRYVLIGGVALNLIGIDPMKALYWAAVVNGLLAPPLMLVTMLIARNRVAMGGMPISRRLAFGGWLATAVMWAVAAIFLVV